ncbi:MAG: carbohydrate kinase family protein [Clostridiaceae bacterium]|nr:carbohydrate kinase family protein [Clostridiaceae bacterium]
MYGIGGKGGIDVYDVACVGILVADAIAKTVDKLPERGKLQLVDQLDLYTGGCAVNAGIAMARIGLNVAIIGKIGNDGFGKFMYSVLKEEKVDVSGLVIKPGSSTSASMVLVDSSGERSFLHCLGANAEFTDTDVDFKIIEKSKIVFIAGTMLMPSFDGGPCARVLKKSKELGKFTALDTAWDSRGRWMKVLEPCMKYTDLFMPSYEEAVQLSGREDPEEIADVFLSMGVKIAVIKLGKDGCFIKDSGGQKYKVPTYEDIKPVDTTGAGDSFAAGFLTGISRGWSLYECGKFANAVGTHCVMAVGASTGIKSMKEILDFMARYE